MGRCVCVCVDGGAAGEGLMKNERMRRLGKLPRQRWPPRDNKEGGRDEERE